MSNQAKTVTIYDRIPLKIYGDYNTNGPFNEINLTDERIGILLNSDRPPKAIFAVKPGKMIQLTLDNYMLPVEELFKEVVKEEIKKEDVKVEEPESIIVPEESKEEIKKEDVKVEEPESIIVPEESKEDLKVEDDKIDAKENENSEAEKDIDDESEDDVEIIDDENDEPAPAPKAKKTTKRTTKA